MTMQPGAVPLPLHLNGDVGPYVEAERVEARMEAMHRFAPAPAPDLVNHPPHYTQGGIECIDAIEAMCSNPAWTPNTGYRLGNVLKYLWRHADKDPVGSLKKARWYLDRQIEAMEKMS